MRQFLINYIKNNSMIYDIYYFLGSILIKILGIFAKVDKKTVLFVSFGGKKFDDSPRVIYEEMIKSNEFKDFKYYWAFVNPCEFEIKKGYKLKMDTLKYFWIAQKSAIWITNSAIERGLNFKKKDTFYINTWHGTPLKKIGKDEHSKSKKTGLGSKLICTQDITLAQSEYDKNIFKNVFGVDSDKIITCDLPRNDELANYNIQKREEIRQKLNLDKDKKVILYAPTYREYERDKLNNCCLKPPIDFTRWEEILGDDYIILFRAHYEVVNILDVRESAFLRNVSSYPNLNELMIASDMLISDYSSIFFDYAILEKPMFCLAYDLEIYKEKRGLYIDLDKSLPCSINKNEEEVLYDILNYNYDKSIQNIKKFKQKYAPSAGFATKSVIKLIEGRK